MATAADYDNLKPTLMAKAKQHTDEFFDALKTAVTNNMSGATLDTFVDDLVTELGIEDVDTSWDAAHQQHFSSLENLINVGQMSDANKATVLAAVKDAIVYETPVVEEIEEI